MVIELWMLCKIPWYEAQATYLYFISGHKKPRHFTRTITNISNQLKQVDKTVRTEFPLKTESTNFRK